MSWLKYAGMSLDCFPQTFLSIRHSQISGTFSTHYDIIRLHMWYLQLSLAVDERPIPEATRSKVWYCGLPLVGIAGSNPAGAWMSVSYECCLLSGLGPRNEPTTRPGIPTECGVSECDRKASKMLRSWPIRAVGPWGKNLKIDFT
jgi:hypothetical protein